MGPELTLPVLQEAQQHACTVGSTVPWDGVVYAYAHEMAAGIVVMSCPGCMSLHSGSAI